jgi:hypothetical protein
MLLAESRREIQWKWGLIVALAMMLLSMFPQVRFWSLRGGDWNGFYAAMEGVGDEVAYSAYINALIDGRPRRNDPYTGRDDTPDQKQPDSLFSIQFVPAYAVAFIGRAFGLSAATLFILLTPLAAGAAALSLFVLFASIIDDERIAATGVIVVLCLGTMIGGHGHVVRFFGQEPLYNYLMFLRRYQPSVAFPLFILFFVMVWRAIASQKSGARIVHGLLAAIIFELLVFSYVYLWTAAVVWVCSIWFLWWLAGLQTWRVALKRLAGLVLIVAVELIPFIILYSRRGATFDSVQALELSRRPDPFRLPELVGVLVLAMLAYCLRRRLLSGRDKRVLLTASFALLPILVFNQQIFTGLSLQPIHYEMFVANYAALIAVVLGFATASKIEKRKTFRLPRRAMLWIALGAFEWGGYETMVATAGSMSFSRELDEARPVATRLAQLDGEKGSGFPHATVLATDLLVADSLPTSAPQGILWAPHMLVFSGADHTESRERFFQYLYYTGVDPTQLVKTLTSESKYGLAVGLFGFERAVAGLDSSPGTISRQELDVEVKAYAEYSSSFTEERARKNSLSYLVVSLEGVPDLSNLERWYERDGGERIGKFMMYRIKLRKQG